MSEEHGVPSISRLDTNVASTAMVLVTYRRFLARRLNTGFAMRLDRCSSHRSFNVYGTVLVRALVSHTPGHLGLFMAVCLRVLSYLRA